MLIHFERERVCAAIRQVLFASILNCVRKREISEFCHPTEERNCEGIWLTRRVTVSALRFCRPIKLSVESYLAST